MFSANTNTKHRRAIGIEPPKPRLIDLAIVAGAIAVLLLPPTVLLPWLTVPDSGTTCSTTCVVKNAPST